MRTLLRRGVLLVGGLVVAASAPALAGGPSTEMQAASLAFEGHRVEYFTAGLQDPEAPTIVLVHGLGCRSAFWQAQVDALAAEARLILVDLLGHAGSDKPEVEYTMELYARNVLAVMDAAGVRSAILAGHSMGVPVVRSVARFAPDRLDGVLAVDGILTLLPIFQQFAGSVTQRFEGDAYAEQFALFVDTFFGDFATDEIREAVRGSMLAAPQQMVLSSMRHMYDESVWKPVEIGVPMLSVMAGRAVLPPNYATLHLEEFPHAEVRTAEGAGHFVMMEAPASVTQALRDLLRQAAD